MSVTSLEFYYLPTVKGNKSWISTRDGASTWDLIYSCSTLLYQNLLKWKENFPLPHEIRFQISKYDLAYYSMVLLFHSYILTLIFHGWFCLRLCLMQNVWLLKGRAPSSRWFCMVVIFFSEERIFLNVAVFAFGKLARNILGYWSNCTKQCDAAALADEWNAF